MNEAFNKWWDEDDLTTQGNPYTYGTPVYWAWEGWQAALAAPVQEPIGYLFQHEETGLTMVVDVQQVEWGFEKNNPRHQKIGPVYTTLPAAQRQWVGLTDEQIKRIGKLDLYSDYFGLWYDFAKAIEAKLKEKNT
jgi:hypothetical protein